MWSKTLVGMIVGLLLTISLIMNLVKLLPMPIDTQLFIGFVLNFFVWAGLMSYFYAFSSLKKPLIRSCGLLLISVIGNLLWLPLGIL